MIDEHQWHAGVIWASESHHVFLTDNSGKKIGERVFKHDGEGLAAMASWLIAASSSKDPIQIQIAIDIPHGPVGETLIERGFRVIPSTPSRWIACATASLWLAPRTTAVTLK